MEIHMPRARDPSLVLHGLWHGICYHRRSSVGGIVMHRAAGSSGLRHVGPQFIPN